MLKNIIDNRKSAEVLFGRIPEGCYFLYDEELFQKLCLDDNEKWNTVEVSSGIRCAFNKDKDLVQPVNVNIEIISNIENY